MVVDQNCGSSLSLNHKFWVQQDVYRCSSPFFVKCREREREIEREEGVTERERVARPQKIY